MCGVSSLKRRKKGNKTKKPYLSRRLALGRGGRSDGAALEQRFRVGALSPVSVPRRVERDHRHALAPAHPDELPLRKERVELDRERCGPGRRGRRLCRLCREQEERLDVGEAGVGEAQRPRPPPAVADGLRELLGGVGPGPSGVGVGGGSGSGSGSVVVGGEAGGGAGCGTIAYTNPLLVVGAIVTDVDDALMPEGGEKDGNGMRKKPRVLLVKRAIEPRKGSWTLPAGYLELGESAAEGAARETWEEARARVEIFGPYFHAVS